MFITPAYAQAAGAAAEGSSTAGTILFFGQFVLLFAAFYFLMIRPQQKRAKEHAAKINAVKKGDQIVTAGGIIGKVTKTDEAFAEVEIAAGVKVKVVKSTINDVTPPGGAKPAND
jgi:preprotein translocase subunit YajC